MTERVSTGGGRDPALWLCVALGLGLRGGLLLLYPYLPGRADERWHYVMGVLLPHRGEELLGVWGPGYETFLGVVFGALGPDPLAARLAQVIVSAAGIPLVYGIARGTGGVRAGRIAAAIWALYPTSIAFTQYFYSETLFITLVLAASYALFRRGGERSRKACVVAGVFFGLATLTRSAILYFLPAWIAWCWLRRRRREWIEAAITSLAALAIVLPWSARNTLRYGDFLLVDGAGGGVAWQASNIRLLNTDLGFEDWKQGPPRREQCPPYTRPAAHAPPPVEELVRLFPPPERNPVRDPEALRRRIRQVLRFAALDFPRIGRCEVSRAVAFAAEEPGAMVGNAVRRFYALWGPNSFLLRAVENGLYEQGLLRPASYGVVKWSVVIPYVGVVVAALLAFGRRRPPALAEWCALLACVYTALHVFAAANSRYRFPLMPFAVILASLWLARPALPQTPARRFVVGALVVGFLALSSHYVWTRLP